MSTEVRIINIRDIDINPRQPRREFEEESIDELATSISEIGLLSPLLVRPQRDRFQLIAGERRLRALKQLGAEEALAIIRSDVSDFDSLLQSISENIHREGLSSVEREDAIYTLWVLGRFSGDLPEERGSKSRLAEVLGLTPSSVAEIIRAKEYRDQESISSRIPTRVIRDTAGMAEDERRQLISKVESGEIPSSQVRDYAKVVKEVSAPVKQALLTPRSSLKPDEALIIDTRISEPSKKQVAIKKIQETGVRDLGDVYEIVQEVSRPREAPKVSRTQVNFTYDWYSFLDTDREREALLRKIGDGVVVERFEKFPEPENPGDIVCPHFLQLKWATGCPFNCDWCQIQGKMANGKPIFTDRKKIRHHMEFFIRRGDPGEFLNAGYACDSLMDERKKDPFSKFIVELFQGQEKHKLLFTTRSTEIKNLVDVKAKSLVTISMGLNANSVAERWEKNVASPEERVAVAAALSKIGYPIRIKLEPIVPIRNWDSTYTEVLDRIFETSPPERVTLGVIRATQDAIKNTKNKDWTKYLTEDDYTGGKRVDFQTRFEIYSHIINHLKEKYGFTKVALCRETMGMWLKLGLDYSKIKCDCIS